MNYWKLWETTIRIEESLTPDSLLEQWANGNRSQVLEDLAGEHPGLAAAFVMDGHLSGRLHFPQEFHDTH